MDGYLKQSTAFIFRAGPFVDATDGVTPETGLTIAQADIQISKAGGAFAQTSEASPTTTHDSDGYYQCPLTTTDVNTVGQLKVQINMSGAAPVWHTFMVLPANVYDSLVAGSDYLDVSAVQIEGSDATDQINAACDAAIETYGLDHLVAAAVSGADVVDNSIVAKIVSSSATADWDDFVNTTDSLQANRDALPTTTSNPFILVDTTIATLASQTSFTLTAGSADDDAYNDCVIVITDQSTSTQKAVGRVSDYVGSTRTITLEADPGVFTMAVGDSVAIAAADKGVAAVLADTNELQTDLANGGRLDLLIDAIKVVTDNLSASASTIVSGTVDTVTNTHTPTTTEFQADDITEATTDHFKGRIVIFTSGALQNQATDITGYSLVGGIGQFTVTALTEAPANNDTFIIV